MWGLVKLYTRDSSYPVKRFSINVILNVLHTPGVGHSYFHRHTFHELVLITCGAGIHVTGGEQIRVGPGDVLVIHPCRSHRYIPLEDFELTNILFETGDLNRLPRMVRNLPGFRQLVEPEMDGCRNPAYHNRARLDTSDFRKAKQLAQRLHAVISGREGEWESVARRRFICLIHHLSTTARPLQASNIPDTRLSGVFAFLKANPVRRVRLTELAALAGMSRSTFQRVFRASGCGSPINHLLRGRLDQAQVLLQSPALSITDVAFQSGFQDSNYFARVFRKQFGVSPREYRMHQLKAEK